MDLRTPPVSNEVGEVGEGLSLIGANHRGSTSLYKLLVQGVYRCSVRVQMPRRWNPVCLGLHAPTSRGLSWHHPMCGKCEVSEGMCSERE